MEEAVAAARAPARRRATWCCSRPPAPRSTCSTTSSTAATSSRPSVARRCVGPDAPRSSRPTLALRRGSWWPSSRVGVVMVYSASAIVAADRFHDPLLLPEEAALLGGARRRLRSGPACCFDYRRLERFVVPLLVVSFVAAGAGARAALRPGDQRHAALVPRRARLLPAGGAGQVLAACSTWRRSSRAAQEVHRDASARACCRSSWWRAAWPRSPCSSPTWATAWRS